MHSRAKWQGPRQALALVICVCGLAGARGESLAGELLAAYGRTAWYADQADLSFKLRVSGTRADMPPNRTYTGKVSLTAAPGSQARIKGQTFEIYYQGDDVTVAWLEGGKHARSKTSDLAYSNMMQAVVAHEAGLLHPALSFIVPAATPQVPGGSLLPPGWEETLRRNERHEGEDRERIEGRLVLPGGAGNTRYTFWRSRADGRLRQVEIDQRDWYQATLAATPENRGRRVLEALTTIVLWPGADSGNPAELTPVPAGLGEALPPSNLVLQLQAAEKRQQEEAAAAALPNAAPRVVGRLLTGGLFDLRDLRGKVVLLDFWATWCGPCVQAAPVIDSLHREFASQGLMVVGVNRDRPGSDAAVRNFLARNRSNVPQVMDSDGSNAERYRVQGIPTFVIVGRNGTVRWSTSGFGQGSEAQLRREIARALAEQAP